MMHYANHLNLCSAVDCCCPALRTIWPSVEFVVHIPCWDYDSIWDMCSIYIYTHGTSHLVHVVLEGPNFSFLQNREACLGEGLFAPHLSLS